MSHSKENQKIFLKHKPSQESTKSQSRRKNSTSCSNAERQQEKLGLKPTTKTLHKRRGTRKLKKKQGNSNTLIVLNPVCRSLGTCSAIIKINHKSKTGKSNMFPKYASNSFNTLAKLSPKNGDGIAFTPSQKSPLHSFTTANPSSKPPSKERLSKNPKSKSKNSKKKSCIRENMLKTTGFMKTKMLETGEDETLREIVEVAPQSENYEEDVLNEPEVMRKESKSRGRRSSKKRKLKKKLKNCFITTSPPQESIGTCSPNIVRLIPDNPSKISFKKKKHTSAKRNLQAEFYSTGYKGNLSQRQSLQGKKITKQKKGSRDKFKIPKFSLPSPNDTKYKAEINQLKESLQKSQQNEEKLLERIQKLEDDQKTANDQYKKMEEMVQQLIPPKPGYVNVKVSQENEEVKKEEIEKYKRTIHKQKDEISYLRQKESKLMYLFYIMHNKGIDVNKIYDEQLRDIPTDRFDEWMKENMEENKPPEISFDSQASYEDICEGPMPQPDRPKCIPQLNLDCIPDYVTSSDEDDANDSSIFDQNKKSIDGSKLHRPSELNSILSMSFSQKDFSKEYNEEYTLSQRAKKRKDSVLTNNRVEDQELNEVLGMTKSLNTDQINFNI
ncbi:unnamed protein product [Moneuplotes crassus]|uniref:Uncharacterized protein n=1 Tax=Euplotes crassus TaxID=5936 RepID=A0AAD1U4M4_EUPCR|nr:unnamed protein product [Moneuplotes crassus]